MLTVAKNHSVKKKHIQPKVKKLSPGVYGTVAALDHLF